MRFWDSSAIVPLLLAEDRSPTIRKLYDEDSSMVVWSLTSVELLSVLARRGREGLPPVDATWFRARLSLFTDAWQEIQSVDSVKKRAERLLFTHTLRAADAVQLGAALVACDERPEILPFVCLDERLAASAKAEGFPVLPSSS